MELVKWDPFRELETMRQNLNRWFGGRGNGGGLLEEWTPLMDIVEDEKAITLKIDVPGIDKKDVKIEVEDGVLTVSGERKLEKEEKKENFTRIERSYGSFTRSLRLPDYVDVKSITAESRDGVLNLTLPKIRSAKPEPRKIDIK
jgi:HSP20 family protein